MIAFNLEIDGIDSLDDLPDEQFGRILRSLAAFYDAGDVGPTPDRKYPYCFSLKES